MLLPLAALVVIATALVVTANVFTIFLVDLTKVTNSWLKRALAAVSSAATTLGIKYLGYGAVVQLALLLDSSYTPPEAPSIPVEYGLLEWISIGVFVWILSGGVWDLGFLKNILLRKKAQPEVRQVGTFSK